MRKNTQGGDMNNEDRKQKVAEFEALCKPLNDWLQKNYHPHAKIIIETDHAEIVEGFIGVPFKILDKVSDKKEKTEKKNQKQKKCTNCAMKDDCCFRKTYDNPPYFRCGWWMDKR